LLKRLHAYGWNAHFQGQLAPDEPLETVARVVQEHKEAYLVHVPAAGIDNIWAEISGKLRHTAAVRSDFPAVGDWVIVRGLGRNATVSPVQGPVQISRILQRSSMISRRLDGKREGGGAGGDEQLLAVNVDVAFLGTSLNDNFNLRRLERYLALAHDAGVVPVVLLTKADLCPDPASFVEQVRTIAPQTAVHVISVLSGLGMEQVRGHLTPGRTAVILGSSGIGKSTLVNHLAERDLQDMMETREFDDKGRHCTTFRNLVRTPTGGLIIDTPGLRGLSLGEATDAIAATFADIEQLAGTCKFTDCGHETEPGCAIKAALEAGTLNAERYEGYARLQRELSAMARRENRILDRKQKKLEKKTNAATDKKEKRKWDRWKH
jgi:ribosome biogenesis GTPase / thiamine phosphate phosphatase